MPATEVSSHIRLDPRGAAWIDDTNVKVIEVVLDWLANRSTAEEMHREYPHLSLSQIHAAMAYYYDHQSEFDKAAAESLASAELLAAQSMDSPLRKKLRSRAKRP